MAEHLVVAFSLLAYVVFILAVRRHAKKYGTAAPGSGEEHKAHKEASPPPQAPSVKVEHGRARTGRQSSPGP